MTNPFDAFLEALENNLEFYSPYEALKLAIHAAKNAEIDNEKAHNDAMEDIHYGDRYGKD